MSSIIEFKDVSFRYGADRPWIIENCSFAIESGESVAIIGHNGSGKSTIAKLMNGLLLPQEGEVWIDGTLLEEDTIWDIRKSVGMVFQNPDNQFVGATVQDDVAFGMENRGMLRSVMEERITSSLTAVHMLDYLMTEPHRLSGGQKQRVAIAGIMAVSPKVMILDEATVMLDPKGRVDIMETITKLQAQKDLSLLTITHDLQEAMQLDRVIVLNKGEIWATGNPRNVLEDAEKLKGIGLDLPFTISLKYELEKNGITLPGQPITMAEMLEDLWTLHSKK